MIRLAGTLLILLGILSATVIFIHPFGVDIRGSIIEFWVLYLVCYSGGFLLVGLGMPVGGSSNVLKIASSLVLLIGIVSALALLLDKLRIVSASGTYSLWLLFILSTVAGAIGLLTAGNMRSKQ